jgi:hypothetical protein
MFLERRGYRDQHHVGILHTDHDEVQRMRCRSSVIGEKVRLDITLRLLAKAFFLDLVMLFGINVYRDDQYDKGD